MDVEAGATRYAITIVLYLTAVTVYSVSWLENEVFAKDHSANVMAD